VNLRYAILARPCFVSVQLKDVKHRTALIFANRVGYDEPKRRSVAEELRKMRNDGIATDNRFVPRFGEHAVGCEKRTRSQRVACLPRSDEFVD
jgi:hypothetical protein